MKLKKAAVLLAAVAVVLTAVLVWTNSGKDPVVPPAASTETPTPEAPTPEVPTPTPEAPVPAPEDPAADEDAQLVSYAAGMLQIGYQPGDRSDHISGNVTLPTAVEEAEGVSIRWTSSSAAISAEGVVTRPAGGDEAVTLTAQVSKNKASAEVAFPLTVIRRHDRDTAQIADTSLQELAALAAKDEDFEVSYTADQTQVTSIMGKYSDIAVQNMDDAQDVIQNIRSLVGIEDAYAETAPLISHSDEYGAEYTFEQECGGIPVFGRSITVSVNAEGTADILSAALHPTEKLTAVDRTADLTAAEAEAYAAAHFGGTCAADPDATHLTFYTLEEYEDAPILTYRMRVSGTAADGAYTESTVFVDADTGKVIQEYSNITYAEYSGKWGSGTNEQGKTVEFPVKKGLFPLFSKYYMQYNCDGDIRVSVYKVNTKQSDHSGMVSSEDNQWSDATAVSAYDNMLKVTEWFYEKLGRKSYKRADAYDMLCIVVHSDLKDEEGKSIFENAVWSYGADAIHFFDNKAGSALTPTTASALDIAAHEYTHAVFDYVLGDSALLPYKNTTGAIDEGYADIFGVLLEADYDHDPKEVWIMGEDWKPLRDISNPTVLPAGCPAGKKPLPDKLSSPYYVQPVKGPEKANDYGGVHTNGTLISHAAYLMSEAGMEHDTLVKLWYKSMSMGYTPVSTYQTVRFNVLKAANRLKLSSQEVAWIKQAFDAVEIYGDVAVEGVVMNDKGEPVSGAKVSFYKGGESGARVSVLYTEEDGSFSTPLDCDEYTIVMEAEGYQKVSSGFNVMSPKERNYLGMKGGGTITFHKEIPARSDTDSGQTLNTVAIRKGQNNRAGEYLFSPVKLSDWYAVSVLAGNYTCEFVYGDKTVYRNVAAEELLVKDVLTLRLESEEPKPEEPKPEEPKPEEPDTPPPAVTAVFTGSVNRMGIDFDSWSAINGAKVTLTRPDGREELVVTGSDGTFSFADYDSSQPYKLVVQWTGWSGKTTAEIPAGYDTSHAFTFAFQSKRVHGFKSEPFKYRDNMNYGMIVYYDGKTELILP